MNQPTGPNYAALNQIGGPMGMNSMAGGPGFMGGSQIQNPMPIGGYPMNNQSNKYIIKTFKNKNLVWL